MWRSELYKTDPVACAPRTTPRLPIQIEPQSDEALVSWVCRMAAALTLSPARLMLCAFGVAPRLDKEWWRRPAARDLQEMSEQAGLSIPTLSAMTFAGWSHARQDEARERLRTGLFLRLPSADWGALSVCPQCLYEDRRPYIRFSWLLGWCGICSKHQAILTTFCPSCLARLRSPSVSSSVVIDVGRCRHCGLPLRSSLREPAHLAAVRLQTALLEIKRNGTGSLAGIDQFGWSTAMALVDVLLHLVWNQTLKQDRDELFARIAADFALDADACAFTPWEHNYGSLLILAWLLDDLDDRLPFAIDTLQSRPLGRLIQWLSGATPDQRTQLRMILVAGLRKRPRSQKPWQSWLTTLPAAAELRARAEAAPRLYGRERLTALAAIRDGSSLRAIAKKLRHAPSQIRAWLDEGARVATGSNAGSATAAPLPAGCATPPTSAPCC